MQINTEQGSLGSKHHKVQGALFIVCSWDFLRGWRVQEEPRMGCLNVMSPKTTAVGDSVKGRLGEVSDGNSKNNVVDAICAPPWSPPGWCAHHTAAVLADRNPSLLRSENFLHLTGAALPRN